MQSSSAQNMYVQPNAANNSTGRTNQPAAGNMYRQNPSSPAPRNRFVGAGPMYTAGPMHQGVVVRQFPPPYQTHTPQLPQCQYMPMFYQYYMPPPQQQRASVNPGVGVSLSNAMAIQSGGSVSGSTGPAGNQSQLTLSVAPVAANTVLGVTNSTSVQPVGVTSVVSIPHQPPQLQPQQQQQTQGKKIHPHRLQIIHPVTKHNILDFLNNDKNEPSPNTTTTVPPISAPHIEPSTAETEIGSVSVALTAQSIQPVAKIPESLKPLEITQTIETLSDPTSSNGTSDRNFKDVTQQPQQQTPIVSAMTDAPSVEIFPTQLQKTRNKKSQNVYVNKQDHQYMNQGETEEIVKQTSDVPITKTTIANSNCVQESLPTSYINQQVPQQNEQQIDNKPEETTSLSSSSTLSLKLSTNINIIPERQESESNCTVEYFSASELKQQQPATSMITESVKTMQLGETLPQQNQINIVNTDEQPQEQQHQHQTQEQKQQRQYANVSNSNTLMTESTTTATATATTLTEPTENTANDNDVANNNSSNINNNNNNKTKNATVTNKNNKLDKKNDNISENKTGIPEVVGTEIKATTINDTKSASEERDEIDPAQVLPKTVERNETSDKKSTKSLTTTTTSNNASTTIVTNPPICTTTNNNIDNTTTEHDYDRKFSEKEENDSENGSSNAFSTTNNTTTEKVDITTGHSKKQSLSFESLINYNEGQWSPSNPSGKKQYNREQLMQLRQAKASRVQPEVKNTSIFSQTNLMPAFASHGNKKVQSMIGFGGNRGSTGGEGHQNYMKQSSMSGRGGPDGGHHNRNSGKQVIYMDLSLNQDVKLNEADNAWRPRVLVKNNDNLADPEAKAKREKEELIRKVRGILNKLTPEKFEPLVEEIIKLKIDTNDKMEAVMILVFEKAIDEPNFSVSYAKLCNRLINEVKAGSMEAGTKLNLSNFRNALIDKTEREFTDNVTNSNAKEEKLKPIKEHISKCTDPNEKVELEALLEEEERKIRRRSGGTVRFIGELFKISILTGKIIFSCIEVLLKDPNNEDMLECLCKLLTTVGQKYEQTPIQNKTENSKVKYSLDSVIHRMQVLASKTENSKISSRVRFMLQDVIDLRKKKWQSTRNEAPKTMEQIEKEANNEQLCSPFHYMNTLNSGGGTSGGLNKRDDRGGNRNDGRAGNYSGSHSQRGVTGSLKRQQGGIGGGGGSQSQLGYSNNDDNWQVQTGRGNRSQALDSNKLVLTVDMNKKMGDVSVFKWPNPSSMNTQTHVSNSFAALSLDKNSDLDRDRDRSGPRNKGSYNKNSMERDRYDHDRLLTRSGSSQASRENSSSRRTQGMVFPHSKYQQSISSTSSSRMTGKASGNGGGGNEVSSIGTYRQSKDPYYDASTNTTQHFNSAASDSNQQHSSAPPPAVFKDPTDAELKAIKAIVTEMVENAANSKCIDSTTIFCIKNISDDQRCGLLYYILTNYLHLIDVGTICRRHLANVVAYLIEKKYISVEHFRLAYKNFADLASVLEVDIPELWLYIFEFTGPLIVKKLITVKDLWNSNLRNSGPPSFSEKFLKTFLQYCTREVGPNFTRTMWNKNHMKWTDFMDEKDVDIFIKTNKFEYIENEKSQPDIDNRESKEKRNERVVKHVEQLLKEGTNADNLIDYINGNIVAADNKFIRSLTTTLTSFAIKDSNNYSLDITCFRKICIPVLLRYLDSKEVLELECLYAIQLLVHNLEHPRGLLAEIFVELNDGDVIPQESFIAWRDSKDQSAGKGVAVKALNQFFNQVINGETSDDN